MFRFSMVVCIAFSVAADIVAVASDAAAVEGAINVVFVIVVSIPVKLMFLMLKELLMLLLFLQLLLLLMLL